LDEEELIARFGKRAFSDGRVCEVQDAAEAAELERSSAAAGRTAVEK
jgi:hypothetical protein